MFKVSVLVILLFCGLSVVNCRRFGGGGRISRPSYNSHRPARPPAHHNSHVSHTLPANHPVYKPAPSYNPFYNPHNNNPPAHGSGAVKPIGFDPPRNPSAPIGHPKHESPVASAPPQPTGSAGRHSGSTGSSSNNAGHPPIGPPKASAPLGNAPPHGTGTVRPIGFDPPGGHHSSGSNHPPIGAPKQNTPLNNAPPPYSPGTGTVRPIGLLPPGLQSSSGSTGNSRPIGLIPSGGHQPSGSNHHGQLIGAPKQNTPLNNAPPPYSPGQYHNSPPVHNPAGYGAPPAYGNPPPYGAAPPYGQHYNGYPHQGGYPQQGGYYPGGSHPQGGGVTIINNNVNNHGGGYYPQGGGYYPHGGWSSPVYTIHDTGSSALGFFLGYSLGRITTPSFHSYHSYYDNGYIPRYDHYTVHHYYHDRETVPKEATIEPNAIVACVADSGSFCPANTTSLCTNNGAVMCVASALSTVPCSKEKQTNCVRSTIPCQNNSAPECKQSLKDSATITIPCISTAMIYGSITYVNNSIVVSNSTTTPENSSKFTMTSTESLTTTTTPAATLNMTTTQVPTNTSVPSNATSEHKGPPQTFCVTILALPAERKQTEGEKILDQTKSVFSTFLVKALGID